jgi:hypothetical protein
VLSRLGRPFASTIELTGEQVLVLPEDSPVVAYRAIAHP